MMWQDYSGKLATRQTEQTHGHDFMTMPRSGNSFIDKYSPLPNRPSSVDSSARPVPFPFSERTVWRKYLA
jgi:hypothetical protein